MIYVGCCETWRLQTQHWKKTMEIKNRSILYRPGITGNYLTSNNFLLIRISLPTEYLKNVIVLFQAKENTKQ